MAYASAFITGMGVVSPIGVGVEPFWESLVAGKSGLRKIEGLTDEFPSKVVGLVNPGDWESVRQRMLPKRAREFYNKSSQMALVAAQEAQKMASLYEFDPERLGVAIGQSIEDHLVQRAAQLKNPESFYRYVPGFDEKVLLQSMLSAPAAALVTAFGVDGPVNTISNACVSGFSAISEAVRFIATGEADIVLAGATEAPISHDVLQGLTGAGLLSGAIRSKYSVRPFDRNRVGSALGDGAAIFVVESEASIIRRGVAPLCRIAAFAGRYEKTTLYLNPDDSGAYWGKTMVQASPKKPDVINCHAPGSESDVFEARGLQRAFPLAYRNIPVFSIKAQIGSGLAAAGGLQTAASILSLVNQIIPGTRNFRNADPEIPLAVNRLPKKQAFQTILQNAFGSGGALASIQFERC